MKRYLVWCLLFAAPLFAQRSSTPLTAANQCAQVGLDSTRSSTVVIDVSGTFSATLQPQVAINGQSARNTQVTPSTSQTPQSTITAAGGYQALQIAGYDLFQVCTTSYTSGTATVVLSVSTGPVGTLGGGGTGAVASVFGRTGAVVANSGDYSFSLISGTPSTTQVPFQSLTTTGNSGAATLGSGVLNIPQYTGAVASVFGRTGAVTATSGDYTAAQVTNAVANNAANAFTSGLQDFSAVTVELPEAAGFTTNVDSNIGLDTTANNWHIWENGVDNINVLFPASITPVDEHCVDWSVVGGVFTVDDAGAQGTATCNPVTSVFGRTGVVAATSGDYTAAQVTNAVALNAGNVYTSAGTGDFRSASPTAGLAVPTAAGAAPLVSGFVAFDTSNNVFSVGNNGTRTNLAVAGNASSVSTTCTNQVFTVISAAALPTCTSLSTSFGVLMNNVLNTGTAGFQIDGSASTAGNPFKTQSKAGATATAAGAYTYDSTTGLFHLATNAVDATAITAPARVSATAQTAAIGTTTLCTVLQCPANPGHYEVHWEFTGGGTACSSVTVGSVTFLLTWTDENAVTHSAVSLQMMAQTGAATTAMGSTFPFQTALANEGASGTFGISTNGTIIQYATGYTACTTGTGTYSLRAEVTRMQ